VEKQIAMSVAFSSKINCGLLSLKKFLKHQVTQMVAGAALRSVQQCWTVFLLLWCRRW